MKIIEHPVTTAIKEKKQQELFNHLENCESGNVRLFENVERGENQAFDAFMDKADSLPFSHKTLEKEAELFNKELMKNEELIFLSSKLNKIPATAEEIKEYKAICKKLLALAKKCGAVNLHETMKVSFDLMFENVKNAGKLNIKI
ncbi:TPA: hypothetical protein IAC10_08275 [Candidatus Scatousia excrementigallinarum]|uniref:Uncharacterized protein n=1 Tax=Candidatus Scatousia excrementigallinarum TaxID=2840935 RepID=A0A9D1EZK4_9BACT|nr:hypothetical protein [Candidatus Scatousia excrementigallinarum]